MASPKSVLAVVAAMIVAGTAAWAQESRCRKRSPGSSWTPPCHRRGEDGLDLCATAGKRTLPGRQDRTDSNTAPPIATCSMSSCRTRLHRPAGAEFVHGGAFVGGDKRMPKVRFYDNIMLWAVKNGFVASTMTLSART